MDEEALAWWSALSPGQKVTWPAAKDSLMPQGVPSTAYQGDLMKEFEGVGTFVYACPEFQVDAHGQGDVGGSMALGVSPDDQV